MLREYYLRDRYERKCQEEFECREEFGCLIVSMEFCSAGMAELQQESCLLLFNVFNKDPGVL